MKIFVVLCSDLSLLWVFFWSNGCDFGTGAAWRPWTVAHQVLGGLQYQGRFAGQHKGHVCRQRTGRLLRAAPKLHPLFPHLQGASKAWVRARGGRTTVYHTPCAALAFDADRSTILGALWLRGKGWQWRRIGPRLRRNVQAREVRKKSTLPCFQMECQFQNWKELLNADQCFLTKRFLQISCSHAYSGLNKKKKFAHWEKNLEQSVFFIWI